MVEDNESDVFLIREALERIEFALAIHLARDGEEAVRFLDEAEASMDAPCPDLIVLDINLPKLQGSDVLSYLRQLSRCGQTKVLVVSTADSIRERTKMMNLGANDYFRKPSQYDQFMKLSGVVEALLKTTLEPR